MTSSSRPSTINNSSPRLIERKFRQPCQLDQFNLAIGGVLSTCQDVTTSYRLWPDVCLVTKNEEGLVLEDARTDRGTATAGSDVVQSGRPIFDDFFQHLWPYIGNNTANVVFQMVKRLWLIRIDQ
ncbi:hypothetical protein TNCV_1620511 [Trichonephila clavipes]|nr:hypothetical protein TNCV_1620511 [Trichonephila clavipes]